jgi:NADP-dependent 3-hydroxy acid dehydrogenase YdfG
VIENRIFRYAGKPDGSVHVLQTVLRVNVVLPHMITQRLGSVVNLAPWAGKTGNAHFAGYSASKLAVSAGPVPGDPGHC